jgi:23S rRNA pseudouridine1911/1915/1917 synthase
LTHRLSVIIERSETPLPVPSETAETMTFDVGESDGGERLDRWLARHVSTLSRARIQALIKDGQVTSAGATIGEANTRVKPGESYAVVVPAAAPSDVQGEAIALNVVFEDASVIVIDKPAGLVVHPAAGHATGTLVNALVAHCGDSLSGVGGVKRPGIVHRLDKDTSGLLVIAKTDDAHQSLSDQFRAHGLDGRLRRAYLALIWGAPVRPKGVIDAALARSTANRTKIAVSRHETARHAVTHYEVLETFQGEKPNSTVSMLRLVLETGRTHQIRVHLAHIGHPVLGDPLYGSGFKNRTSALSEQAQRLVDGLGRQALHAEELGFEHPKSGKPKLFKSPLPADIAEIIDALKAPTAKPKTRIKAAAATEKSRPKRSTAKL